MSLRPVLACCALLAAAPLTAQTPAPSPAPQTMLLAQAQDRCMATHAVRLTHTDATDDQIWNSATTGCQALQARVDAAITSEYTPKEAQQLSTTLSDNAKPNFVKMLARIRADRLARAANAPRNLQP